MTWSKKKPEKPEKVEIPADLKRALANRPSGIDSQELLAEITRQWGGSSQLAFDLVQEFKLGARGGIQRQRILEMVQRLIISNTDSGRTSTRRPSEMSTDELEEFAADYFNRVTNKRGTGDAGAESGES